MKIKTSNNKKKEKVLCDDHDKYDEHKNKFDVMH